MKIIKKSDVKLEPAHGGAGSRKLFVANDEVKNIQGITHGFLAAGGVFGWHKHDDCNEFMYVLKGNGIVRDADGEYPFTVGDFFIFPRGIFHEQRNTGKKTFEAVFIRTK
ncbi:MAG: cupin domain-containing protein [Christensenellaceae bacterium]|jgi:mannose-6-phosphate isomerase-like protein (cupin superfamily)|nr:cupin domain-containing protein [Christensenellaceae bacterium]